MSKLNNITKEFWIAFAESDFSTSIFVRKEFGHVYILTKDEWNWMILDPRTAYLYAEIMALKASDDLPKKVMKFNKHRFIRIKTELEFKEGFSFNFFRPLNCVNVVQYVLGLNLFVFTPYGLYKKLKKMSEKKIYKHPIKEIEILEEIMPCHSEETQASEGSKVNSKKKLQPKKR